MTKIILKWKGKPSKISEEVHAENTPHTKGLQLQKEK